jgi:hypothetical protein
METDAVPRMDSPRGQVGHAVGLDSRSNSSRGGLISSARSSAVGSARDRGRGATEGRIGGTNLGDSQLRDSPLGDQRWRTPMGELWGIHAGPPWTTPLGEFHGGTLGGTAREEPTRGTTGGTTPTDSTGKPQKGPPYVDPRRRTLLGGPTLVCLLVFPTWYSQLYASVLCSTTYAPWNATLGVPHNMPDTECPMVCPNWYDPSYVTHCMPHLVCPSLRPTWYAHLVSPTWYAPCYSQLGMPTWYDPIGMPLCRTQFGMPHLVCPMGCSIWNAQSPLGDPPCGTPLGDLPWGTSLGGPPL